MEGKIYLYYGIKLSKDYNNVVDYTPTEMLNALENKKLYESENMNYIDYITQTIKLDCQYQVAIQCNYLAFQNPRHGNKWYFAFIDDVKYESPKQCTVSFTIDVWTTFYNDWTPKPCFVVREHVNDDTIGKNTTEEPVGLGNEFVVNSHIRDEYNTGNQRVIVASNIEPSDGQKVFGGVYQGVPTGFRYYSYAINDMSNVASHINTAQTHDGNINQLFIAPEWLAGNNVLISDTYSPINHIIKQTRINSLNGHRPRNNKLLTWPYCYFLISNGQGQDAELKQELWALDNNNEMRLEINGCLTAGCSIRLVPLNYNGDSQGHIYGINLGKFPQLCWATDPYVNWLTEQGVNVITRPLSSAGQVASGNIAGGFSEYINYVHEMDLASKRPPQVSGNTNAGDVTWAHGENCFHIMKMSIKSEYASRIDDFFDRFGYQINDTKKPNLTGRRYWNYIKIGAEDIIGVGTVPPKYMEVINNICRNGVTIWHNENLIGNFNFVNDIVVD